MSDILAYVGSLFSWLFVTTTGTNAHTAAVKQVIDFVVAQPYLMIGLSLMLAGSAIAFLCRLIRST